MNMFKTIVVSIRGLLGITLSAVTIVVAAEESDGKLLVSNACAGCHSIEVPSQASQTVREKVQRKAPPLHYAGQKYQQEWLRLWLQSPQRITPTGGAYWAKAVVVTDEGDEIVESKLPEHIAVSEADAGAISDYLSSLKPYPNLMEKDEYTPKKVNSMLAKKDFRKFKGCSSCHRDAPDFGGVSGPELYTAMNRLSPDFIAAYIRNPTAFDPRSTMPNKGLNNVSIHKLMNYLNQIKENKQ